jgi:Uncharacterized protein conserved in bacteria
MELKFPLLSAEDIEVKVKKITQKGAIALLYKTARVDMNILDAAVTPLGWKCSYRDVKGNLYCEISIYDNDKQEWVSKEDCGIESREDDEGNQRKGEASDAFKRAGFKWGIGRELYTAPFTFISCPTKQKTGGKGYDLANPFAQFSVKSIGYDDSGKINALVIVDDNGKQVYKFGQKPPSDDPKPDALIETITKAQAETLWESIKAKFGANASDMVKPLTLHDKLSEIPAKDFNNMLKVVEAYKP